MLINRLIVLCLVDEFVDIVLDYTYLLYQTLLLKRAFGVRIPVFSWDQIIFAFNLNSLLFDEITFEQTIVQFDLGEFL